MRSGASYVQRNGRGVGSRLAIDWVKLVRAVKHDPSRFCEIQDAIGGLMKSIAIAESPGNVDDAMQVGWLRIWRVLGQVDLTKNSRSIKAYIIRAGVFGIRDEVRRLGRQEKHSQPIGLWQGEALAEDADDILEFGGVLARCLEYVEKRGTIAGAYTAVARDMEIKAGEVSRRFRQEAEAWIERNQFDRPVKRYAIALGKALRGTEFDGLVCRLENICRRKSRTL